MFLFSNKKIRSQVPLSMLTNSMTGVRPSLQVESKVKVGSGGGSRFSMRFP